MMRSIQNADLLMLNADTGASGGGTAVAVAQPAPAAAPTGETVTAATPATPARAKRGKAAAGTSVFPAETLEAALADAKNRGGRFTGFTVKVPGKPDRFFCSNHRNAVQHAVMTGDGYVVYSGDGSNRGGRHPKDPAKRASELLETMSEEARRELFAKYIGTAPAVAASLPPAPPRDDTTAEFAAATGNGNVGSVPAVGNQPGGNKAGGTRPAAATPAAAGGRRR